MSHEILNYAKIVAMNERTYILSRTARVYCIIDTPFFIPWNWFTYFPTASVYPIQIAILKEVGGKVQGCE